MTKKELRLKYKQKRNALSKEERDKMSILIGNQSLKLNIWEKSYYHLFLPIERLKEIDTIYILNILQGKDKNVIIPKTDFENHCLENILLTEQTLLKKNNWGIVEPVEGIEVPESKIQVIFVPLLAYDTHGNRVGYGKGFYDRFLEKCYKDTLKIGLSFFPPEEKISDTHKTDIPLDYCITPDKIFKF